MTHKGRLLADWRHLAFLKGRGLLLVCLANLLILAMPAHAQTGTLSADPLICTIPGGNTVCSTTLSWISSGTSAVQLWVSDNGGTQVEFDASGTGGPYNADAPWIGVAPANSYAFTLYDYSSGSRGATLASTTVTGLYAISLTWGNSTNSVITPDLLVSDYWTLNISGAPPSAPIVWAYTLNGEPLTYYTLGYTNGSGTYSQSAQETIGSVGTYTGQWQVSGVNAGDPYPFQVIRRPSKLLKQSTIGNNCDAGYPYGVSGSIDYQIQDTSGTEVDSVDVIMYPYFNWNSGGLEVVGSASDGANNYGQFTYEPLFLCGTAAFGATAVGSEILSIKIGGSTVYEPVRTQSWTAWGYAVDSGRLYNGTDIDITQ